MDKWLASNNLYLAASLQWLRLRLQKLIPPEPLTHVAPPMPATEVSPRDEKGIFSWWRGAAAAAPARTVRLLLEGTPATIDDQIAAAAIARDQAASTDPPPALILLSDRFGLSTFERDTLLLCAAFEFDTSLASLCALVNGGQSRSFPTFSLALSLFDDPRWDVLSAHRPLRYARLIDINQPASVPLTASPLRADERIVNYLKGLNVMDDRLLALVQPVKAGFAAPLAQSQQEVVQEVLDRFRQAAQKSTIPVVQLVGGDASSRIAVAAHVCGSVGRELYRLPVEALPTPTAEIEILARLWQRESLLRGVALYVEMPDSASGPSESFGHLKQFLSRELGLVFVGNNEEAARLNNANIAARVNKPTAAEQCAAWTSLLGGSDPELEAVETAHILAGEYDFSLTDIHEAASMASNPADETEDKRASVWRSCRELTRTRLDSLAQRLEPKATWEDLILPPEQMALMRQIAGQVRERHKVYEQWGFSKMMNRGFGISALFAGESGTGKTMAAEVIANDLQLNLYRIDLSAVVSKYIGETEKNLRKLFNAAEGGGAILFFDEADALFGKRSEVKDSHDRYANIEINYLLQRMEAFSGLAILATNMKAALDSAFMRRLRFIVNLPFPGLKERNLIWQKSLPALTPQKELDFDRLARLNVSGGNIHSIALNAAFLAAQNGQVVTMPLVLTAARAELRKLEKGFSEAELR